MKNSPDRENLFFAIEAEIKAHLNGDNLKISLDFLAYLKGSGMTWDFPTDGHPEFYYIDKLTCLFAFTKDEMDEATLDKTRQMIESAGNRFVYDPSSTWNICCWQCECDIYEPGNFQVGEDLKEFALDNVWKCISCGGCDTPGSHPRTVFGKEYASACCNVFQFINPDSETMEKIIKLMELQKAIIAESALIRKP